MEVFNVLFNRLLSETAKRKASSLHLSVGSIPVVKKDEHLIPIEGENIMEQDTLKQIVESILNEEEKQKLAEKREITVVKVLAGKFRFKINVYYQKNLLSASFRFISDVIRDFLSLNLPEVVSNFSKLTSGLLIIAGTYGSGKTSTISAIIEKINQEEKKKIITIEDPIEVFFVNKSSIVEQRQIGRDVLSLVDGLKYCLHQEVDVLVVHGTQDEFITAIPFILEIASSNCLVILELNADSSIRAIEKVLEAYPSSRTESARLLLADVLEGIIIQKLLSKLGGGLAIALEIIVGTSSIKSIIGEGKIKQMQTIIQTSGKFGMVSMNKSLVDLVQSGQISREEAISEAENKEEFKILVK